MCYTPYHDKRLDGAKLRPDGHNCGDMEELGLTVIDERGITRYYFLVKNFLSLLMFLQVQE
jgi:hypothetical protein